MYRIYFNTSMLYQIQKKKKTGNPDIKTKF